MDIERGVVMKKLRVIFMGTPIFCAPILEELINKYNVILIVTQPDRKKAGKDENIELPIKEIALKNKIKLLQPEDINKVYKDIANLAPNIIITCAYGQILNKDILAIPPLGCINVHASLLPKLRGGAPIHRAIINGFSKTGITIIEMVSKMDAGPIIAQAETAISDNDNVKTLHDRLSLMGKDLLMDTLPDIISGNITKSKQEESEVTYAWNIERKDEKIDFSKNKRQVYNQIRGLNPWPGAYAILDSKIHKIWTAKIGNGYYTSKFNGEIISIYDDGIGVKVSNGEIIITEMQIEGKKKIYITDYLNGIPDKKLLLGKIFE